VVIKVGDVVDILSGYAFKSTLFNDKGNGLPLVRIRDVGKKESSTFYSGEYKSEYLLENGDFIIGMDGEFRLASWQGGRALLNQRVCKIKPLDEKVDSRYFYYFLPQELKKIEDVTSFATVKHLSVKDIKSIEIPLPPLAEQQQIAAILDAADCLRQKDQQLIDHYTALSQALFLDMFGDPVTNPMGWEFDEISNLMSAKTINGFFAKKEHYDDSGVPIVWITDFINKVYVDVNLGSLRKVNLNQEEIIKYKLAYGDALFCRSSLTVEGIGKCAIVPKHISGDVLFECHIIKVRFGGKIVPEYFRFFSDTVYFRNEVMKRSKTSTMTTISQKGITEIHIPVPPLEFQSQFAERVANIEQQKQQAQASLEKSEALFNSLLQRAFNGELTGSKTKAA